MEQSQARLDEVASAQRLTVHATPPARGGPRLVVAIVVVVAASAWRMGPRAEERAGVPTVAIVGGQAVTTADLAAYWFARYPEEYARTLDDLVDARLARTAAAASGLGVPQEALDAAEEKEVEARREQVAALLGEGATLEERIEGAYGVDVPTWRARILRPRLYDRLLVERVVRHDTRSRLRLAVRVLVRPDEPSARALAADAARGADFGALASKHSLDPTARRGGELPSFGRGDLAWPDVEAALFAAAPGGLVGPLRVEVDGKPAWHLYKVVERQAPWSGDAASRGPRLERDLVERPVEPAEYERWRARAAREAGVKLFTPAGQPWK
ncbi:MAG: peptidylprolyl isomerase [Planctomycetota bacterium]